MSLDSLIAHMDDQDRRYRKIDPEGKPLPGHPDYVEPEETKDTDKSSVS